MKSARRFCSGARSEAFFAGNVLSTRKGRSGSVDEVESGDNLAARIILTARGLKGVLPRGGAGYAISVGSVRTETFFVSDCKGCVQFVCWSKNGIAVSLEIYSPR